MGTHRFTRDPGAEGLFQLFQDRAHLFLGQGWICFAGSQGWGDASLAYGLSVPTPHRPCCHPEGMPLSPGLWDAQQQPARHTLSCPARLWRLCYGSSRRPLGLDLHGFAQGTCLRACLMV
ncbi:uncharacterized protein LOC117088182 isoform X2 [Trachypithecus francoisi]|uniref:uncharacterized protein LOC117088182 isoform X2 n=1 Tax=Trachypithecus francoisi TaxID=54180 RepID=UPI00141B94E5|nr:uncharacterized protein LOC117088182 isoform X2 [Trachypithecus francoisi]